MYFILEKDKIEDVGDLSKLREIVMDRDRLDSKYPRLYEMRLKYWFFFNPNNSLPKQEKCLENNTDLSMYKNILFAVIYRFISFIFKCIYLNF